MKRVLLATTAIAGLALVAQNAQAEGFTISGGVDLRYTVKSTLGITKAGVETASDDLPGIDAGAGLDSYELKFAAEKDLDSGLTSGMVLELDTRDGKSNGNYDKFYGYLKGGFGEIQMGYVGSAADQLSTSGYAGGGTGHIDGGAPTVDGSSENANGEKAPGLGINGDSGDGDAKLVYLSPEFSGVKAGVSYAFKEVKFDHPDYDKFKKEDYPTNPKYLSFPDDKDPFYSHLIGVGVSYNGDFGSAGKLASGLGFAVNLKPINEGEPGGAAKLGSAADMGIKVGAKYTVSDATIGFGVSADLKPEATKINKALLNNANAGAEPTDAVPMAFQVSASYNFGAGDVGAGFLYGLHGEASSIKAGAGVGYSVVDGFKTALDVLYSQVSSGEGKAAATIKESSESALGVVLSAAVSF